jgi:hypothetical protein
MVGRYLAQDVRDFVVSKLDSEFNTMIGTINTERTHTTPTAKSIAYHWGRNQFPFLMVDIEASEGVTDAYTIDMSYVNLPEVYTLLVAGFLKYANDNVYNYVEDWIEAVIRVLHNYNDGNISWIAYTQTERGEIYKNENETLKSFVVELEIRVN